MNERDAAASHRRRRLPFGPWWWGVIPQVLHGASVARESPREPVTPWGTEAVLAASEWTRVDVAVSLVDALARAYRLQRRLPADPGPSARDVRRAIHWRAFHEARTAFGGPWGGWREWTAPAVEAAERRQVSEEAVRVATASMKTDAVRRLLLGFDAPDRPTGRVASAAHVASRWGRP